MKLDLNLGKCRGLQTHDERMLSLHERLLTLHKLYPCEEEAYVEVGSRLVRLSVGRRGVHTHDERVLNPHEQDFSSWRTVAFSRG